VTPPPQFGDHRRLRTQTSVKRAFSTIFSLVLGQEVDDILAASTLVDTIQRFRHICPSVDQEEEDGSYIAR